MYIRIHKTWNESVRLAVVVDKSTWGKSSKEYTPKKKQKLKMLEAR